jgi:hypothetical protein
MDDARIVEMVHRGAEGFWALAASVDLIGMSAQMVQNPCEARARLNDLQQGFGEALCLYPGGAVYRVCFAGDSVFVIREIEPEARVAPIWASFCGHMFAVAGLLHEMDRAIGNPGLRVVVAAGPLFQLADPESWKRLPWRHETQNWFVLTGASVAFAKCWKAERLGTKGGFRRGYCWHERLTEAGIFLGTRLARVPDEMACDPSQYGQVYSLMASTAEEKATLAGWA